MNKNPHDRILKAEPKEQYLNIILSLTYYLYIEMVGFHCIYLVFFFFSQE